MTLTTTPIDLVGIRPLISYEHRALPQAAVTHISSTAFTLVVFDPTTREEWANVTGETNGLQFSRPLFSVEKTIRFDAPIKPGPNYEARKLAQVQKHIPAVTGIARSFDMQRSNGVFFASGLPVELRVAMEEKLALAIDGRIDEMNRNTMSQIGNIIANGALKVPFSVSTGELYHTWINRKAAIAGLQTQLTVLKAALSDAKDELYSMGRDFYIEHLRKSIGNKVDELKDVPRNKTFME